MTFSKLTWLKRTNGHKLTGTEVRVLVSIFNHTNQDGRNAHPGVDLIAEETGYRKSGVSEAVTALKARGWIHETYRGNGRSKLASVFDLVPDPPDAGYTCPADRAKTCSTCSNSSGRAEPLSPSHSSAVAEPLSSNSSGLADNSSAVAEPIVPVERNPSDPLPDPKRSDPLDGGSRPSDPEEVRYPPNHRRDCVETVERSLPSEVRDRENASPAFDPTGSSFLSSLESPFGDNPFPTETAPPAGVSPVNQPRLADGTLRDPFAAYALEKRD